MGTACQCECVLAVILPAFNAEGLPDMQDILNLATGATWQPRASNIALGIEIHIP